MNPEAQDKAQDEALDEAPNVRPAVYETTKFDTGVLASYGTPPVVETRGLCRSFGDLVAVDELDLDIWRGEVFGFLGPNGAGKSTTLRMMMGLMEPSAGSVHVLSYELPGEVEQLRPRLGYMTQRFSLYEDLSVIENLEFAAEIFGLDRATVRRRIGEVLEEYGLTERREQRPATLSGGWKQRLALAAAVVHEPEILFLDEPTAGVDPDNRRLFWDKIFALAERGTTVLVSTHYMDEAMRCHRLCVMRDGRRVALGAPEHLTEPLAGRVLEIAARPIGVAVRLLQERPEVASLTQLGRRAHLLLTADAGERGEVLVRLLDHLGRGGVDDLEGEIAEPHLEDALIILSRGESLPGSAT